MLITRENLKDPKIVFCAINNFMVEVGEDFIDRNESIVKAVQFIMWLTGKGHIKPETADKVLIEPWVMFRAYFVGMVGDSFLKMVNVEMQPVTWDTVYWLNI